MLDGGAGQRLRVHLGDAAGGHGDRRDGRGDIETQTEASLKALKHCLEAAGSSLDKVVMVRIYAVNSGFYNAINRVYAKYFSTNPPARSFVPVASWPMEFDIEIECVAVA